MCERLIKNMKIARYEGVLIFVILKGLKSQFISSIPGTSLKTSELKSLQSTAGGPIISGKGIFPPLKGMQRIKSRLYHMTS